MKNGENPACRWMNRCYRPYTLPADVYRSLLDVLPRLPLASQLVYAVKPFHQSVRLWVVWRGACFVDVEQLENLLHDVSLKLSALIGVQTFRYRETVLHQLARNSCGLFFGYGKCFNPSGKIVAHHHDINVSTLHWWKRTHNIDCNGYPVRTLCNGARRS